MDIRSWITHKVRSQRGASLSMALMLMLVCTTVAAIVLAAGTAAAGRLYQVKDTTKTYYNVTSAAKLLSDQMQDGVEVRVVRKCSSATRGDSKWVANDGAEWSITINDKPLGSGTTLTLFERLTCDLIFSGSSGYSTKGSLNERPVVSSDAVKSTVSFNSYKPMPLDIDYVEFEYSQFDLKPSGSIADKLSTTHITVKRNEDETFYFTVTDSAASDVDAPSVYTVVAAVSLPTTGDFSDGDTELTWVTTATWKYLYTISGGGA